MNSRLYRPETIVFDMDGTLCDVSSLRHLVAAGLKTRNFDEFHTRSVDCPPIKWVRQAAREASSRGLRVIQVTARQEKYRAHTSWWLADQDIPSDGLFMRPNGDFRPDYEVKNDMVNKLLRTYDIRKAYDDNPSIVQLWRELNIPCVIVPGWKDE